MQVPTVPMITRFIEILFAVIILSVYYGTDTLFKVKGYSDTTTNPDDCKYAGDNFGQFVMIGGLVLGIVMTGVTMLLEKSKIFAMAIVVYNVAWFVFYLSAAILILNYWSGNSDDENWDNFCTNEIANGDADKLKKMKNGGLTIGSFMLFQDVLLLINTGFVFMAAKD
ncbi:hypothetical protein Anas_02620 [Armadillidium nasatum]|uniref:MARVEL domain-containing protein n=1 Tax=Armadillidium nasatum TaxID=96803 RepID=A0A5N5TGM0_9CRUS|nr:hypothetical protein Anas_02620 [Armadillidium nasatum]